MEHIMKLFGGGGSKKIGIPAFLGLVALIILLLSTTESDKSLVSHDLNQILQLDRAGHWLDTKWHNLIHSVGS
jgi:hypothetical protein